MANEGALNASSEDFQPECDTYLLLALMHSTVHAVACELVLLEENDEGEDGDEDEDEGDSDSDEDADADDDDSDYDMVPVTLDQERAGSLPYEQHP
jgi:hypothetical protein